MPAPLLSIFNIDQVFSRAFRVNLPAGACAEVTRSDTSLTATGVENGETQTAWCIFRTSNCCYQLLTELIEREEGGGKKKRREKAGKPPATGRPKTQRSPAFSLTFPF